MLPGMDGISLCRKLRSEGNEVKILILSAKDKVKEKVLGLDAGADDYLTKLFSFEELLARVRALLRKRKGGSSTRLQVADLSMDLLTHKVMRAGREIELTAKEFSLLEYLMLNAGTVVTRTMIAEHVWDVNFDTFTNVIDVFLSYLRNKIDREFPEKLIKTVRGRGYMLKG
jgi:DNA-binding response OmpR family regulator